jgi:hypothetical protein
MKINLPLMNDADKVLKALCKIGVVSGSINDLQCKRKIVELGLTIPEGKNDCLLFGRESEAAFYTFVYFRDPARSDTDQGIIGLRFDCVKYLSNPLAAECGLREACILFTRAVAKLTGIDVKESIWCVGHRSDN